jgi:Ser/Thr protein kinase RdoA (MazF antagonist)
MLACARYPHCGVQQPPPPLDRVKVWVADWELPGPLRVRRAAGGFTSHVWRLESTQSTWLAELAYQPPGDVENGLRAAAIVAKSGLNTGPPLLTRGGTLSRLVEYPVGHHHALAVLHFVQGQPLDWRARDALSIVGKTLGIIHRSLLQDGTLELRDQLFTYLIKDDAWGHHPELQPLLTRAIVAVRTFEARQRVTYGATYGDGLQVRIDSRDGTIGVIDWGTISFGPLVFDLALAAHGARRAGHTDLRELWASYLDIGPVRQEELEGLRYYEALMWARSAKYFAYRLQNGVSPGDARPGASERSFARAWTALRRLVG